MIKLRCESCGTLLTAPDQAAGTKGQCRKCGHLNLIPTPLTEAAEETIPITLEPTHTPDRSPAKSVLEPLTPESLLEATLAPEEAPSRPPPPVPGSGSMSAATTGAPATQAPPKRSRRRRRRRLLVVVLTFLVLIGVAALIAWPRIWEHLNAGQINRLLTDARVDVTHNQLSSAKAKYYELLDIVGDRTIHNAPLRDVVNSARREVRLTEEALAAAPSPTAGSPAGPTTAPTAFVSVTGQVTVAQAQPGTAPQPVAGVTVVALKQKMSRVQLRYFYDKVIQTAQDEEQREGQNAMDLLNKAATAGVSANDEVTWRQFAAQDLRRAKAYQAFIDGLQQTLRALPAQQDLTQVRLQMLEVDLHLRIARGKSSPEADFTKDLIGTDFDSVITATRLGETLTDAAGKFTLKDVPAERFYLYAFWHSGNRAAEWLVPIEQNAGETFTQDLGWQNTAAHN